MKTLKVLSLLLSYPTEVIQTEAQGLKDILKKEALLKKRDLKPLLAFIDELAEDDLMDIQERYVHMFDRTRLCSLHLFEHVHGESRDRGQAMVDLLELYEKHGLKIEAKELPDYIPMFLEFLSTLPDSDAIALLGEPLPILGVIRARLENRESPYAIIFNALEIIFGTAADPKEIESIMMEDSADDPDDFVAIDAAWEEKEVRFGPDAPGGDCPKMKDILSQMNTPDTPGPAGDK